MVRFKKYTSQYLRLLRKKTDEKNAKVFDKLQELSSDEEAEVDLVEFRQKTSEILNELSQQIELEISEDFFKYDLIKQRFEKWKKLSFQSYQNAYISLSLPKLFSPLIRCETVSFNPLEVRKNRIFFKVFLQISKKILFHTN